MQPNVKAYVDKHKGQKALVCGMGTSIDQFPLSFYENFDGFTVGVNEITDLFEPDYFFPNVAELPEFERCIKVKGIDRPISFEFITPSHKVDTTKNGHLSMCATVAVPALTLAYQLGAREIYIIGVDFKASKDDIYFKECKKERPDKYFLASDDPEVEKALRCFDDIYRGYAEEGIKVTNLSDNSRLERNNERYAWC